MAELPLFPDFVRQLNTPFRAKTAHGEIELQLVEAKELSSGGDPRQGRTPMSLIFVNRSQPHIILSQGTYQLDHPALGTLSLFVVPVVAGRPTPDYQVLIN